MSKASLAADPREVDDRYRSIFFTEWDTRLAETLEIAVESDFPSGKDHDKVGELITGLAVAPLKVEGSDYDHYAPQPGKNVTVTSDIYKFAFKATEELRDFGQSSQTDEYARLMAQIMDHTIKVQIYNMLNRGFNSSYPTLYEAKEMCATNHTLATGGTATNELATPADPSETSLESLIELLVSTPNEDGVFMPIAPRRYVTAISNWGTAMRLTGSSQTTLQGTGESGNAIMAVTRAWNILPHFSPYLTDADASFVIGDRSPIRLTWARRPDLRPVYIDPGTDDWIWRIKAQWKVYAPTWRGIVGTAGAA